ncbi:MAG: hypothetical protein AVDCRST_MAG72-1052 [uncultured Nocardioidaceae bacterium]|uniref:Tetracycline resistance protein n=1 Tax=uncultured Nocardioidaceae bacterium TaxID=253824 RepID=A0A6J4LYF2_9ACTN|nr:MAG: hypothetical protein AVDCRST_MAG72-1052 [uncultured Nocardioidaceae bacterium]
MLVGLLFGLAGMGSASVAVALPALAGDLGLSTGESAWVISLYALMLAVATAVYGRLSDLVGIRLPLLGGVLLMAVGAGIGAWAPSYELLLVARLLQGTGAAAVPTLGVAIISTRYVGSTRAAALGRVAGVAAAVACLGPLAGGGLTDLVGWRAVIALPAVGLLVLPLLWRALSTEGSGARLDLPGAALVAGTAAGLVLLVQSPSAGFEVASVGALLLIVGLPSVTARVRRRPEGFLPLRVIRNSVVVRSALAASAIPAAWFALLIAVPAVLVARGWQPWHVGLALVPSAVAALAAPKVAAPTLQRLGHRMALVVSGSIASGALVVAAVGASVGSAVLLVIAVVAVTGAFGLGQPALIAAVGESVSDDVRGVALGVATLMFLVGGGVGSAVVGGFGDVVGIGWSLLLLSALPVVGVAVLTSRRRPARSAA